MALFWIAIIAAVVVVARAAWRRADRREEPRVESALDVLMRRYARGEIDRAEFDEKRKLLS